MSSKANPNTHPRMEVIKRNGKREKVSFDKVTRRIEALCWGLNKNHIDPIEIAQETIKGIQDGITTVALDYLSADICATRIADHPDFNKLAARICISNLHKSVDKNIWKVAQKLYHHVDNHGEHNPLISKKLFDVIEKHHVVIQREIDYDRDYLIDFFGMKTLERSYLKRVKTKTQNQIDNDASLKRIRGLKKQGSELSKELKHEEQLLIAELKVVNEMGVILECPQEMWMRVALGIHGDNLDLAFETYHLMSQKFFTHATPTLFNAGSDFGQLSSCFLLPMDDSIEGIFKTITDCAKISKLAGGIGVHVTSVRSTGSRIRTTNGNSSGLIPWCRMLCETARSVNQGGKRKGSIACFTENTEVMTINRGVQKIQDIEIGDLVVTHLNRIRPVVQVHKNLLEDRKIYKLEVEKNKPIYVTGNHNMWSFYTKNYKCNKLSMGWNSIEDLKALMDNKETKLQSCYISTPAGTGIDNTKDYVIDVLDYSNVILNDMVKELRPLSDNKIMAVSNNNNTSQPINRIWHVTEDLANLIGMWLGDGHIRKTRTGGYILGIGFTVHSDNKDEITYIHKVCENIFGCSITYYVPKNRNITQITLNSHMIGCVFMELFGSYFDGKKLPNMVFGWSKNLINSLIAGLITTDGNITKQKQNATISLSNKNLVNQLYHLCRNNGIDVSYRKCNITKGQTCPQYSMSVPLSKDIVSKTHKLYADDRIQKCLDRLNKEENKKVDTFLKILSITETDRHDQYVYTLGVEEDHSYTVEGLLAQNCFLEPYHADIYEFLELRKNTGDEMMRARDLFTALWIPDLFMKRVEENGIWSLMCPDECPNLPTTYGKEFEELYTRYESEGRYRRQVRAQDLWFHILEAQIETGMPYMAYKDNANHKNNQKNLGVIRSSNLCCEIFEYSDSKEYATCNLASISLPAFLNNDNTFDFEKLKYVSGVVTRNLDKIIDINHYPVPETKVSNLRHRPLGVGVQGLCDTFCMMKIPFDSDEARILNRKIHETIYFGCLQSSCELAKKYGTYETFKGSPFSEGKLQYHLWGLNENDMLMDHDWRTLIEDIKTYGVRNSLLTAMMPTASTSQILGNNECIEPFTTNLYTRSTLAGEYTIINSYLVEDLIKKKLWNKEIRDELKFFGGSVQMIDKIPDDIKLLYRTAYELPQRSLIQLSIDRGPFVDQSQSLNLFFGEPDFDRLTSAHFYGWENGLKTGLYYLRTKPATNAIMFGLDPDVIDRIKRKYNLGDNVAIDVESLESTDNVESSETDNCSSEDDKISEFLSRFSHVSTTPTIEVCESCSG